MKLTLKVIASASQEQVVGWLEDSLKVKVKAKAQDGRANKAVIALLAKTLKINKQRITILSGQTSSRKIIKIQGLSEQYLKDILLNNV